MKEWLGPLTGIVGALTILGSVFLGPGPERVLRVSGALIGLAALPLVFLPFRTLRRHGRPAVGGSYMDTTVVVEVGLYSVVRHPQYLGYLLFMAAFSLLSQRAVIVGLAVVAAALLYLSAVVEERACVARFGEDYEEFRRCVPRFNLVAGVLRKVRRRRAEGGRNSK